MGRRILKGGQRDGSELVAIFLTLAQRCAFILAGGTCIFFSSPGLTDDGPEIEHQEMETATAGETILLRAEITDSDGVLILFSCIA